jgi:hypothetical protein
MSAVLVPFGMLMKINRDRRAQKWRRWFLDVENRD